MPKFEVQLRWDFNPSGTLPADLLDEHRKLMVLAVWPKDPITVEAADAQGAVQAALSRRGTDRSIFVNDGIGRARVEELTKERHPGTATSVVAIWATRKEGESSWKMAAGAGQAQFSD